MKQQRANVEIGDTRINIVLVRNVDIDQGHHDHVVTEVITLGFLTFIGNGNYHSYQLPSMEASQVTLLVGVLDMPSIDMSTCVNISWNV